MKQLRSEGSVQVTDDLYSLALGPDIRASVYSGCVVNGVKFLTKERDCRRATQNSGVCVEGEHRDKIINFYGVLTHIIELRYVKNRRVVLFKCDWFDLERNKPIQIDEDFTSINISKIWYESDSYVLANQVTPVYYVLDTKLGGDWRVVQKALHRHLFDPTLLNSNDNKIIDDDVDIGNDAYQQDQCGSVSLPNEFHEIGPLYRKDIAPEIIDVSSENFIRDIDNIVCEDSDNGDSSHSDKDDGDDVEARTDSESYSD